MSKLNETDVQGFVIRGYNFPFARYLFLEVTDHQKVRRFIDNLLPYITTGEHWDDGKPQSTVNIAFTHKGLALMQLPDASLLSFPVEFLQGMKARADILGDSGPNGPENWDEIWREERVHAHVDARKRGGVACRGPRPRCGAPRFDRHNGLLLRYLGRDPRELPRIAEALEVQRDHTRLRVVG